MVNKTKRTIQDTDSYVRRPVPFFYVRFYITLFFDRLCRNVYDRLHFTTFLKVLPFWRIT